jgi:flagellar hook assembly protein FlgD
MPGESVLVVRRVSAVLACAVALVSPAVARAGDVAMRVQDIPLGGRTLASADRPMHFNMLAAHWRGAGVVSFRTHRLHGGWSDWQSMAPDGLPDTGSGPWHEGDADWTGGSDGIQFHTTGHVTRLRAYELWSRVTTASVPDRRLTTAGEPAIVTRAHWGANEKIVRAKPLIAKTLKLAIVHHTAGTNDYTPAQAAAIVRGIEQYHVQGNGWNDIGYNFLVDRFGTVYEGRGGGMTRAVIGAHAEGFNTATVGVAMIGNFSAATPPRAQQDALVKLLAWRLDVAHIDPLSTVAYTSGGNLKYHAGKVVTLHAISGHRDTGPTACPGTAAYRLLPAIAKRVAATGLPKIYGPTVVGTLGGPIRFQARLSSSLAWMVTVTDAAGRPVAHGGGTGTLVDWTWHSPARKAAYGWSISAPGALAASGTIGGTVVPPPPPPPVGLSLTGLAATPGVITPAPDGTAATSVIAFDLSAPAQVTATVLDASGAVILQPLDEQRPAGQNTFTLDATALPDGRYTLSVVAKALAGASATATVDLVVDRTISGLSLAPALFSPNGDGVDDTTTLSFALAQAVQVHIDVEQQGAAVATLFVGTLGAGPHSLTWDGTDGAGGVLPAGTYAIVVSVTDALGTVPIALQVTVAP